MDATHFGLRQRPFPAVADSASYYPATGHERALAQLLQAIADDESCALLTAEPGLGKTILGHCLLDRLGDEAASSFLTNSHFANRVGLLQAILYDLALPCQGGEQELRLALTDFLLKNYEAGRRAVLVVDEAHHLTPDLLEELRLLGNLEGRQGKAVQVVLLAQPAILDALRLPELASLAQRLAGRAKLEPLGLHEAADYLVHHLRAAGATPEEVIADEALEVLARGTQGVPRLLNRAAHQALSLAAAAGATLVDAEAAIEALTLLGLSAEDSPATENEPEESAQLPEQGPEVEAAKPVLPLDNPGGREAGTNPDLPQEPARSRRLFVTPRRPA
jgi:type II secretory pathway predicted ATPase ExeA